MNKKKSFIVLTLLFTLVFSMCVFAKTEIVLDDEIIEVPDIESITNGYNYTILESSNNRTFLLVYDADKHLYCKLDSKDEQILIKPLNNSVYNVYEMDDETWVEYSVGCSGMWYGYNRFVCSSVDVLTYSNYECTDTVFFQGQKVETLTPVIRKLQPNLYGALSEIISLLPLLLLAIVSYLGLRKVSQILLVVLRQS